ncbi:hypothetical protein [Nonomuraea salmonea]|uniref:hypothetical protein n=1 Tax=Nonomuraea salmonea TaxID=46181 RepID=UPI0031EFC05F
MEPSSPPPSPDPTPETVATIGEDDITSLNEAVTPPRPPSAAGPSRPAGTAPGSSASTRP